MRPPRIIILLTTLFIACLSIAEADRAYFPLGEWKLGDKQKILLQDNFHFRNIEVVKKKKEYTTLAKTIFSDNTPARLFFSKGRLHRLELTLYEGADYEKAKSAAKSIIRIFEAKFGGAFLEGYTTSEGLKAETFDLIVDQVLEKSKATMSEINNEKGPEDNLSFFNMYLSLSTEHGSKGNFLYGKFSYFGDGDVYNVTVYEDKKFNKDHVEPAMIHIDSKPPTEKEISR